MRGQCLSWPDSWNSSCIATSCSSYLPLVPGTLHSISRSIRISSLKGLLATRRSARRPCCQPVLGTQTSPTQSATMDCMLCTAYLVVAITTATAWSSWNTTLAESTGWSTGSLENLHARISTHVLPVHAKTCPLQIPTLSTRLSVTLHAAPWSLTPVLGCGRKQGCVLGGKTLAAMEYACTESARCAASRMGILPPFHPAPRVRACVYI